MILFCKALTSLYWRLQKNGGEQIYGQGRNN
jgi:hypothetical protein